MPQVLHEQSSCSLEGCGRPVMARGLCAGHYTQQRRNRPLSPLQKRRPIGSPPVIRCRPSPCPVPSLEGPCMVFQGRLVKGYGKVDFEGKKLFVHRYVWEKAFGPIPPGLVIDHQCRNRACCNVSHLRLVTALVNVTENVIGSASSINAAKTSCPQGHPYDDTNTFHEKRGARRCRICNREKYRRWKARQRGQMCHKS